MTSHLQGLWNGLPEELSNSGGRGKDRHPFSVCDLGASFNNVALMVALAVARNSWIRRKRQLEFSPAILVEGEDLCRESSCTYTSPGGTWAGLCCSLSIWCRCLYNERLNSVLPKL